MKSYPNYRPRSSTAVPRSGAGTRVMPRLPSFPALPRAPRIPAPLRPVAGPASAAAAAYAVWTAYQYYEWYQHQTEATVYMPAGWMLFTGPATAYCPSPPPLYLDYAIKGNTVTHSDGTCGRTARFISPAAWEASKGQIYQNATHWMAEYRWYRYRTAGEVNLAQLGTWRKPKTEPATAPGIMGGQAGERRHVPLPQITAPGTAVPLPPVLVRPGTFVPPVVGKVPWWRLKGFQGLIRPLNPDTSRGNDVTLDIPKSPALPRPWAVAVSSSGVVMNRSTDRHRNKPPPKRVKEKKTRARKAFAFAAMAAFALTEVEDLIDIAIKNYNRGPRKFEPWEPLQMDAALERIARNDFEPAREYDKPLPKQRKSDLQEYFRELYRDRNRVRPLERVQPFARTSPLPPVPQRRGQKPLKSRPKTSAPLPEKSAWLAANWQHIDVDRFVWDVVVNELFDYAYGTASGKANKAVQKMKGGSDKPYAPVTPWYT